MRADPEELALEIWSLGQRSYRVFYRGVQGVRFQGLCWVLVGGFKVGEWGLL